MNDPNTYDPNLGLRPQRHPAVTITCIIAATVLTVFFIGKWMEVAQTNQLLSLLK